MAIVKELLQQAALACGIPQPSSFVGSTNDQARALLALGQQEGRDLARRHNWQRLTKERVFATIPAEVQTNALPTDFDRFVSGTFYNRSKSRIVTGPLTPQEYADYKGRLASIVYDAFRLRGNAILILPTPASGETMAFEYVSKWWASTSDELGGTQERITADTDVIVLDDEVWTLGVTWRWLRSRGLDYSEPFQQYELALAALIGRDGGRRTLNMGGMRDRRVPRPPQAPDGNWPL
jgi:hypothetical protein